MFCSHFAYLLLFRSDGSVGGEMDTKAKLILAELKLGRSFVITRFCKLECELSYIGVLVTVHRSVSY